MDKLFIMTPPSATAAFKGLQSATRGVFVLRQSQESLWFWCRQTDFADFGGRARACVFAFSQQNRLSSTEWPPKSVVSSVHHKGTRAALTGHSGQLTSETDHGGFSIAENLKVVSQQWCYFIWFSLTSVAFPEKVTHPVFCHGVCYFQKCDTEAFY